MAPLSSDLRKLLDKKVVAARDAAEDACRASLATLGVEARQVPSSLTSGQRQLRNALRAKQRQLAGEFESLVAECAYEQWHLMLFARFLAENGLLIYPGSETSVSLEEVAELARDEGQSDPWLLAASYAKAMLPGFFRPADPCVRLPLTPEGRKELEDILDSLPSQVFAADDALGWVYQFWQTKKKKEVNASERKIGGADLAPVTQLFTEHYMVRFLLENSLGAWWAARHPDSPLLASFDYLRLTDEGEPAAGSFEGWPDRVAEITVMDPCCGSGHFLVAAFEMLRRMREEEEGLSEAEAVDAVLRDNLYGLELDARCVQIAAFALALAAWKAVGYHELPALNLACSGIPTRGSLEEWTKLAEGDERLERALTTLHELFREADSLGSLIDPRRAVEDDTLLGVPFEEVAPLLEQALASDPDPVAAVFGEGAREVARAATLLAGSYTLVATNPPFLGTGGQSVVMRDYCERWHSATRGDLAFAMAERCASSLTSRGCSLALVLPQTWMFMQSYRAIRMDFLRRLSFGAVVQLGEHGFQSPSAAGALVGLVVADNGPCDQNHPFWGLDLTGLGSPLEKDRAVRDDSGVLVRQAAQAANPDGRIVLSDVSDLPLLCRVCSSFLGLGTGDYSHFGRKNWEIGNQSGGWSRYQVAAPRSGDWSGLSDVVAWDSSLNRVRGLTEAERERIHNQDQSGQQAWQRAGVAVALTRDLRVSLYSRVPFDKSMAVLVPDPSLPLAALWCFCRDPLFSQEVRRLDQNIGVANGTLVKVPFDLDHWQKVAEEQYPDGLPEPHSEDPTQWLFKGNVVGSEQPLHVALARLLGYRWPDQEPDELDRFADEDGIVCLPSIAGERPAHDRLRGLLVAAYGESFSQQTVDDLLADEKSKTLEAWLRDRAFASHVKLFHKRPFIWHVWDGRKDGFAALLNYHKLDEQTLQKLTYTHLGWWIDRQKADVAAERPGAEARLAAAIELQEKLKLILEGEPPYDIYVRWKPLSEQPLGWQPDLDDGVRLNIRPFVTAGVLRSRFSVHWRKDRGKNPDGSERVNDLHFTLAEKRAAGEEADAGG